MKNLPLCNYVSLALLLSSCFAAVGFSRCELFIINKTATNAHDSWFDLGLLKEFLADESTNLSSVDAFEGFKRMVRTLPPAPEEKPSSWVPQSIKDVVSRISSNSKKEEVKSRPILKRKFDDLKHYLEHHLRPAEAVQNKTSSEDKGWSGLFSLGLSGKNSTDDLQNGKTAAPVSETQAREKTPVDGKSEGQNAPAAAEGGEGGSPPATPVIVQCEKNVLSSFKDCIERCKAGLKQAQYKTGGISPLIISELNACIHNCRSSAQSSNCKLSAGSLSLINEEIPMPKPTIRRNQKSPDKRSRGLLSRYIIDPVVSFLTTLLFCLLGVIVVLYYFKEHRLYPRAADYVTYKIESYYTEDEKRRAIFEGDGFPQQPKVNWKRTIIYFVRLNFLPRILANNFTWLIPMRDHYQQTTDPCNYVRVH